VQQSRQQAGAVRVAVLRVLVPVLTVPVICAGMVPVMPAGSGQRIAHVGKHASDNALQHINR